ncbi:hypothetical protein MMC30_004821 [Trapelia coarctata]|nr:hypothetical protein [Trapelia coarctata]
MLLTSGQISMTISSCVVFIFTSLLFLSGYVLQQQTVRSLQAALHPPLPPPSNKTLTTHARPFGHPPGSTGHASYQAYLGASTASINWKTVAYVQLVRSHMHVCNAAMLFADLARQKSPAQRILLYPRSWDLEAETGKSDQRLETSMRLLRVAAVRYAVVLSPIDPILQTEDLATAYPLSGLFSLTAFDKIVFLRPSGLVVQAEALDAIFGAETNTSVIAFSDLTDALPPVTLLNPSSDSFDDAMASLRKNPLSEASYLAANTRFLPPPSALTPLTYQTSSLRLAGADFDADEFLAEVGYVQLDDPEILGPEYDIPRNVFLNARPESAETRRAWEDLYERYRMRRMDICGLDLEPMPEVEDVLVDDREELGAVTAGDGAAGEDGEGLARTTGDGDSGVGDKEGL